MKKLITEVKDVSGDNYQLHAELTDCTRPEGHKMLSFSSVWTGAKDPKLEQNKFRMILSPDSLNNLKEIFESK